MFHILLSPAKTLNFDIDSSTESLDYPLLLSDTKILARTLKTYSSEELGQLMGISNKLADLNFSRFQDFRTPMPKIARPALSVFQGDVYMGLEAHSLTKKQLSYAQDHLSILSGFYGLIRPLDLILPYRLEMGTSLKTANAKNLYEFWQLKIQKALVERMSQSKDKILLHLASEEYFKSIQPNSFPLKIVLCQFKNLRKEKHKIISFLAKKARGKMARFVLENKIKSIKDLECFNESGYVFCKKESKENLLVFKSEL
ncbi:UPF0246 protein VC0395_A1934/VC395_2470 [Chlamydiales bacterium SCGC AB-751-O23]|jgi:uncharacterized protein|nr:UPF0246 protein VC0395_A1934/VC395_2470 [Chlamydiales bacterium SCGC AB-751-O23]